MPTPTEQKIMIAGQFDTERINSIKQLMKEEAIEFGNYIDRNQYKCMGTDGDWRESNGAPVAKSTKELYLQSKQK